MPARNVVPMRRDDQPNPTIKYASRREVEEQLAAMPEHYLECREDRHNFKKYVTASKDPKDRWYTQTKACTGCGLERTKTVDLRTGEKTMGYGKYPEGYLFRGIGRVSGDAINAVNLAWAQHEIAEGRVTHQMQLVEFKEPSDG